MRALAALCLLGACAQPAPELLPHERAAGAATLSAWRSAGLPEPDKGCDVSRFTVRLADHADYFRLCRGMAEASAGCLTWDSSWRTRYPRVIISPTWQSEPGIIVHELLHAFVRCAGIGPERFEGDSLHTLRAVWEAAGGAESVQARAMGLLAR